MIAKRKCSLPLGTMENKMSGKQVHDSLQEMFGGNAPKAVGLAWELDESILSDTGTSRAMSIGNNKNPFDAKTSRLLFLAAALAKGDSECTRAQTKMALKAGASQEEIIFVMKIVRHAAFNGVLGNFTPALEVLTETSK